MPGKRAAPLNNAGIGPVKRNTVVLPACEQSCLLILRVSGDTGIPGWHWQRRWKHKPHTYSNTHTPKQTNPGGGRQTQRQLTFPVKLYMCVCVYIDRCELDHLNLISLWLLHVGHRWGCAAVGQAWHKTIWFYWHLPYSFRTIQTRSGDVLEQEYLHATTNRKIQVAFLG